MSSRLSIREFSEEDAEFILKLLTEDQFLKNIGDRGVMDIKSAERYIINGPQKSYKTHGFGLFKLTLKNSQTPIGMCGLIKREGLEHPDLGFALLQQYCQQGYAFEASREVLEFARNTLQLKQVWAITSPENIASQNLLIKLGLSLIDQVMLEEISQKQLLFAISLNS